MDNTALQKISDTIARSQKITIAVSKNPSLDQMAAALSLALTLESQGKKISVVCPTEPLVELSSLVGIDKVATSSQAVEGDLIVSFPYREGEIEKVFYTIENGFLNIVVKAGKLGLAFTEQDVLFRRGSDKPELLFTIGVSRLNDIDMLFPKGSLKDTTIINIDNSNTNEGFGSLVLVSPKFSSLSEQVADLILNLGYDIDLDTAQNLLSGVTAATNNFQSPHTSYLAFEIASILMKRGAVRPREAHAPQASVTHFQQRSQQSRREERQDRRDAIRDALRAQSQARQEQRGEQIRSQQGKQQQSEQNPPSDWLTPKVYKGSTAV